MTTTPMAKTALSKRIRHAWAYKPEYRPSNLSVWAAYLNFFCYGALNLMTAWTQGGLGKALFGGDDSSLILYAIMAQFIGAVPGTIFANMLLKRWNLRYILALGYFLAAVFLILISQINEFTGISDGSSINGGAVALFVIFTFLMGTSFMAMAMVGTTFFGTIYSEQAQSKAIAVAVGMQALGGGIVPLVAAEPIYNLNDQGFSTVQQFYYIAAGIGLLGAVGGYFVNYKHSAQSTKHEIVNEKEVQYSIMKPVLLLFLILATYMICETAANYMFNRSVTVYGEDGNENMTRDLNIKATQGFGLLQVVTGLWRVGSGLFILPKSNKSVFAALSAVLVVAGFAMIWGGVTEETWGIYFTAVVLGLGLGNISPCISALSFAIDQRRISWISVRINFAPITCVPGTQLIAAAMLTGAPETGGPNTQFFGPIIFGLIIGIVMFASFSYGYFYYRNFTNKIKQMQAELDKKNAKAATVKPTAAQKKIVK